MKLLVLCGAALVALAIGPASAADLAVRPIVRAPAAAYAHTNPFMQRAPVVTVRARRGNMCWVESGTLWNFGSWQPCRRSVAARTMHASAAASHGSQRGPHQVRDPDAPAIFEFGFLQAIAERGMHRLPLLGEVGFDTKRCWAGYYAETPDHHAIIGEANGVFVCTGFGGHGIMHSPAAGEAIAQMIEVGRSDVDVTALRPGRFAEGDLIVEEMVI